MKFWDLRVDRHSNEAGNNQTALDRVLATSRANARAFIARYFCDPVTVRPKTDAGHGGFSDVSMKQGFYRSEAFELGEPGELNVGERRHRRTSRRAGAYA